MKRFLTLQAKRALARRGYRLSQAPAAVVQNPDSELTLTFEHVVHHYLATLSNPADFFFVQIGAFDGVTNDPLHSLIRRFGWRGILVEPQRDTFEALEETARDQPQLLLENVAIAAADGESEMFRIEGGTDGGRDWRRQQTSFRRDLLLRYRKRMPDIESRIVREPVRTMTLATLLAKHEVRALDLLQIDAEGYDLEILRLVDFDHVRPSIVRFEHQHLSRRDQQAAWNLLVDNGYRIARESSVDTVAVG